MGEMMIYIDCTAFIPDVNTMSKPILYVRCTCNKPGFPAEPGAVFV